MCRDFELQFSYNQFVVYDGSVSMPGCIWTDLHVRQGFARRESVVCFGTILEFGKAHLTVFFGPYAENRKHQRAISTPFDSPTGKVLIEGPEESETNRFVEIAPGHYRVTAAQLVADDDREEIELYFEKVSEPAQDSKIIIADEELEPPTKLAERAEIAEV